MSSMHFVHITKKAIKNNTIDGAHE